MIFSNFVSEKVYKLPQTLEYMTKKEGAYSVEVKPGEKVTITKTKKGKAQKNTTPRVKAAPQKQENHLDRALVENLIALQKINVGLTEKFEKLANEISQLLALFEVAARSFAKNAPAGEYEKDKDFLEKIDKLLDQNKVLAKGLTLMEERLRERMYTPRQAAQQPAPQKEEEKLPAVGRPLPKF